MKNIQVIIIAIIAILLGLGAGYLIFGKQSKSSKNMTDHDHAGIVGADSAAEAIWTCSMHPQIRQNEPGLCPICEMDLILLETNTSNDPLVLEMSSEAVKLANIQTTLLGSTGTAEKTFSLSGKIQIDERLSASQVAHIPGRIEKLYVTYTGEQVNKGQKLATLYSPELISAQKELLEALSLQDVNEDLLLAARKKLEFWKITEQQIQEIEESGTIQETFTIFADASGIVTNRRVAVGDHVKEGTVLFDIVGLNRVWVLFDAYEEDLASIKVGDRVEFTTPALPSRSFTTRINFIDPMINPNTRVAALRGEVLNKGYFLKPEMLVRGKLQSFINKDEQLLIPKSAVLWTGTRSVVYVKVPDRDIPSFQFREIDLGERMGPNYLVESGLESGEEVVTYGSFTIDAAAQLNNQASMMNKKVKMQGADPEQLPDYTKSTPEAFKSQLSKLVQVYLLMKDALVATDSVQTSTEAKLVMAALEDINMNLLEGDAHNFWMEQAQALKSHGQKMMDLEQIEGQRKQFDFLSQALIQSAKVFGLGGAKFYIQHCPMAADNTGADWISDVEEVLNPYFGEKMLKCGFVETTIQ